MVDILTVFRSNLEANVALPVAAMIALVEIIKHSKAGTWMQLEQELRSSIELLKNSDEDLLGGRTNISLGSGCDLFMKYVTRAFSLQFSEFSNCKEELLRRGERFTYLSMNARAYIGEVGQSFIQDGSVVLIHGLSRVVTSLILKAAEFKQFNLIITEGREISANEVKAFLDAGIPTKFIPDSAVGIVMESIDLCLVGAEGVMENGGIVNKIGTYQIALIAHALKKPFYVAVESYKFARMYPLSQRDTLKITKSSHKSSFNLLNLNNHTMTNQDNHLKNMNNNNTNSGQTPLIVNLSNELAQDLTIDLPNVDFTPARYITLLFTDLGVLTPAAVSDELIRLYQ